MRNEGKIEYKRVKHAAVAKTLLRLLPRKRPLGSGDASTVEAPGAAGFPPAN